DWSSDVCSSDLAVSICGVSAAIATAGAIKGDTRKLSYVISLVLIIAIPMMIFMPMIANHFNFSEEVTGAWLGGSIDTTGAVVASGTLVGETALKVSTIVKFSQNVMLGIARSEERRVGYEGSSRLYSCTCLRSTEMDQEIV